MIPKQTAKNYDQLAAHWAGENFNRDNGIAQHQRAFRFARGEGSAIDIGCGSSGRLIEMIRAQGFDVEGLDYSTEMLKLAKEKHPDVEFHHADVCSWQFPKSYDFISAWDSVWHVPLQEQEPVLEKLCNGLTPGGVLIYTSGAVDEPGEVTNPFLGQPLYTAVPGIPHLLKIIAKCHCVCRHLEYDEPPPGRHLYLIIQKFDNR